jgi:periplasmic protein TonB
MRDVSTDNGGREYFMWYRPQPAARGNTLSKLKEFTLAHGFVVSMLLHACLVLFLVTLMSSAPRRHIRSSNRLNVEMIGLLSNRQVQALQKRNVGGRPGITAPRQQDIQKVKTETAKKETVQKETAPMQAYAVRSETPVDSSNALRLPEKPTGTAGVARSSGSGGGGGGGGRGPARAGGDAQQQQQYIGRQNGTADALTAYLAQLTRRLRTNLIYPQEAKKKKLEGVSLISFVVTESGGIKSGTLAIRKSSGYALLDASALKTAQLSAPFQKPPRELSVSIAVAFDMYR